MTSLGRERSIRLSDDMAAGGRAAQKGGDIQPLKLISADTLFGRRMISHDSPPSPDVAAWGVDRRRNWLWRELGAVLRREHSGVEMSIRRCSDGAFLRPEVVTPPPERLRFGLIAPGIAGMPRFCMAAPKARQSQNSTPVHMRDCSSPIEHVRARVAAQLNLLQRSAFPGSTVTVTDRDGRFDVEMRQPGLLRPLTPAELYEGTLRYLLLVAALLSPRPLQPAAPGGAERTRGRVSTQT